MYLKNKVASLIIHDQEQFLLAIIFIVKIILKAWYIGCFGYSKKTDCSIRLFWLWRYSKSWMSRFIDGSTYLLNWHSGAQIMPHYKFWCTWLLTRVMYSIVFLYHYRLSVCMHVRLSVMHIYKPYIAVTFAESGTIVCFLLFPRRWRVFAEREGNL